MNPQTPDLISLLDRWAPRRVVVVGDFMLDRYAYGDAERLSPDAPVPVLTLRREDARAGGAANVCLDLRALRCTVAPIGVVGDDEAGRLLRESLTEAGCEDGGLVADGGRPTTVKHNFIGLAQHRHPQKMFRVDTEDARPVGEALADRLLAAVGDALAGADAVVIEDYGKGALTEAVCQGVIRQAKERGLPVLVDPAAIDDYTRYRGATCLTPNRTEAERATGMPSADAVGLATKLRDELELDTVVLTLDKQGALLLEGGKAPVTLPTVARSVYDVTGAGDMVVSMLAGARANGAGWPEAVALANTAAGLEVQRQGVVPIELEEVLVALLEREHEGLGKRRTLSQLLPELSAYRKGGRSVVFTNGCFDILHAGHVQFLREAAKHGDLLVVGLNTDASIRRLKGEDRPVNHEADRVLVLSELASVDYVVTFEADTPMELIEAIKPDVLVKGADYTRETVVGHEAVEAHGGRVALIDLVQGRSTTNMIRKMRGEGAR